MKLFTKIKEYTKSNGVKVSKYKPNTDIYINAIDINTGHIKEKKITEYSVHENLKMYRVESLNNQFKTFWVSDNHSLIAYNFSTKEYSKIRPDEINEFWGLVQMIKNGVQKIIPYTDYKITFDPTHTTGYDFTVEDFYTFCTDDGVFVQDTMAVYTPLSKESIEEVKEKMMLPYSMDGMSAVSDELSKDYCIGKSSDKMIQGSKGPNHALAQ